MKRRMTRSVCARFRIRVVLLGFEIVKFIFFQWEILNFFVFYLYTYLEDKNCFALFIKQAKNHDDLKSLMVHVMFLFGRKQCLNPTGGVFEGYSFCTEIWKQLKVFLDLKVRRKGM